MVMKKIIILVLFFIVLISGIIFYFFQNQSNEFKQGCVSEYCKEYIITNKDTSKTLDMVIIPGDVAYGDYSINYNYQEFLNDKDYFIETLFSVEPFDRHKDKFNIYIYEKNLICYNSEYGYTICGFEIGKNIEDLSEYNQEIGYFDIYLIMEGREGGGLSGSVIIGKGKGDEKTNLHELGHYFGLEHSDPNVDIMSWGPSPLYFSDQNVEIINSKLTNWRDCYIFEENIYTSYNYDDSYYCNIQ